jgi:hypothetical protein
MPGLYLCYASAGHPTCCKPGSSGDGWWMSQSLSRLLCCLWVTKWLSWWHSQRSFQYLYPKPLCLWSFNLVLLYFWSISACETLPRPLCPHSATTTRMSLFIERISPLHCMSGQPLRKAMVCKQSTFWAPTAVSSYYNGDNMAVVSRLPVTYLHFPDLLGFSLKCTVFIEWWIALSHNFFLFFQINFLLV